MNQPHLQRETWWLFRCLLCLFKMPQQSPTHRIYLAHPHTPSTQDSGKSHWFMMFQCFKGTFLHGISFAHILVGSAHSVGTTAVGLGLVLDLMSTPRNKAFKHMVGVPSKILMMYRLLKKKWPIATVVDQGNILVIFGGLVTYTPGACCKISWRNHTKVAILSG